MSRHELIPVAYRPPFAFGQTPWVDQRPHGQTLLEIVQSVPNLPRPFLAKGVVCINGEIVPRELWSYVRPKPTSDDLPIAVTLHWSLGSPGGGGGGSTTKSIIGLVAAIALVVVTAGIGAGFAAPLLGASFAAGTFGAAALAGVVGIAGALAISALTAPPTQEAPAQIANSESNTENRDPAGASGNIIAPGGSIPRVIGTRKIFPPLVCEPVVELIGNDEWVEALFALNGPHVIDNLAIDGMIVDDELQGVETESTSGFSDDAPIGLITRQGRTTTPQITLSQHNLSASLVLPSFDATQDIPIFHRVITRIDPSEIWIHLLFPGGIYASGVTSLVVPFRVRMRRYGDTTWINLPEFHIAGNTAQQTRRAIIFYWDTGPTLVVNSMVTNNGFVYARREVPPQTVADASPETWTADGFFDSGAGNEYLYSGNETSTRIRNIKLSENKLEVFLDEGTFPRADDKYEIEIKRGSAFNSANFTKTSYFLGASVKDFFWYFNSAGTHRVPEDQSGFSMSALLVRVISIWNEHPVGAAPEDFALLAIKARNRQLQRVSVEAGSIVPVWGGSDYSDLEITSNPAWHYRDVLLGAQNLDPLNGDDGYVSGDNALLDEQGIRDWADMCDAFGWTCNAIIDDMRTQDVLTLLASCGYAKPYQSDQYGITIDNDRTADAPIQVFSRINAAGVRFEKAFARVPEGFIVNYRNEAEDDDRAQTIVYQRDPSIATTGLLETISYDGLIAQDQVEARALFDLDQANIRSTFYTLDTDIESIVCRRGSLVALQHDVLTSRAGDAHIVSKTLSGSPAMITGFVLDAEIHVSDGLNMHAVTDMHSITDMHDVGITTGIAIRHTDGTISTHLLSGVGGDTATITLAVPFADDATIIGYDDTNHTYGSMLVCGNLDSEYIRLLVLSITPTNDLKAKLVLVDEAPDLVRFDGS